MAAAGGATTVYYGTPWDDSTLLEQAAQTNLELERRDGVRRHFTADWTEVARYNPAYGRYVQGESRRLGAGHPLFRTQYELRTVAGGGRLFDGGQRGQLQGSHARRSSAAPGETYVAGLDLAGQELRILHQISQFISSTHNLDQVLRQIVDLVIVVDDASRDKTAGARRAPWAARRLA